MNLKSFKPITETKYLSVENAWRYRAIMRIFYQFDMRFKHWLSKEDIYAEVMKLEAFAEYTLELCRQDLDALCQWGNLSAVQDASKVAGIWESLKQVSMHFGNWKRSEVFTKSC